MPKLTSEQRAELERQLAEDDAADDDFEVEIRDGDKSVRLPYGKGGKAWLRKHGFEFDPDPAPDADADPAKPGKGGGKDAEVRRFGGRRVS